MSSTSFSHRGAQPADWRSAGLLYYSRNFFFQNVFGKRVWRVCLDGGFSCPNRDGTVGVAGCIFCNPASYSPSMGTGPRPINELIDEGVRRLRARYGAGQAGQFVAYFQPGTNTHAPVTRLSRLFGQAVLHRDVVGLIVGTRPDSVPDEVLDLLASLAERTWVLVEYGLQTIHDRTLDWLRRGHRYEAFLDAVQRSRQRGLQVGAHVILGLPGESCEDMLATARELARLQVDSVKLHNLHAVRDTPLADLVSSGEVQLAGLRQYVGYAVDFLEELAPTCVVDRLSADAPRPYLVGPQWCLNRSAVRGAIEAEFRRRGTFQSCKCLAGGSGGHTIREAEP